MTLRESFLDRRPEIQHVADLDGCIAADRLELGGSGECTRDDFSYTPQRRFAGTEVAEPERRHLKWVANVHGCDLAADRDVVGGELREDGCLERATDRSEQRHVKHVTEVAGSESEVLPEPDREEAAAKPVLERLAGREVRREGERPDELGEPDAIRPWIDDEGPRRPRPPLSVIPTGYDPRVSGGIFGEPNAIPSQTPIPTVRRNRRTPRPTLVATIEGRRKRARPASGR